jgi:hypothetical protein
LNTQTLIESLKNDGLTLEVTERLTVKVEGAPAAIEKWASQIREHKPEIVAMLRGQQEHALHLAKLAIEQAALRPEQKVSRLADVENAPLIAHFWAQLNRDDERNREREE